MASTSRTSTIFTVAGITVLGGILAYAVYFDYKRRNDHEFRKKLKKEKKRLDKSSAAAAEANRVAPEKLSEALEKLATEELPRTPEEKEQYFMTQVSLGETLAGQGPAMYLPAAMAFYRGLRVYPSPMELIMIYEKTVPPPIFSLILQLTNGDVQRRVEGYYNYFPKKSMNVTIEEKQDGSKRRTVVAAKDFNPGDLIYKEEPAVATLDKDLQDKATHCTHCLRLIHKATAIKPEGNLFGAIYCSEECELKSKPEINFLFGSESILPPQMDDGTWALNKDKRAGAQATYISRLNQYESNLHSMVARFFARQVSAETMKLAGIATPQPDVAEPEGQYSLTDHVDRLRYIEMSAPEDLEKALSQLFNAHLPGLEATLAQNRYATFLGKMAYNSYGVCYSGGRDDRPPSKERPENQERTRTPFGTSRQIGSALYFVSSYIAHSCDPNARPSFSSGTAELHLVASKPIKKGEEITVAYVDVTKHDDETEEAVRRRRRIELARGWRFKCECTRCLAETSDADVEADKELGDVGKDGSKVEELVRRVENGEAAIPGIGID